MIANILGQRWWSWWLLVQIPCLLGSSAGAQQMFSHSRECMACHDRLVTPSGEDVSIGQDWRPTMMANSARDPYWQAAVRRELLEHPKNQADIENECSRCHLPMDHIQAKQLGKKGEVFSVLGRADEWGMEGVSCTLCHQIQKENLGQPSSFVGHFQIDLATPFEQRKLFGPFEVKPGLSRVMRSASAFVPTQGNHLNQSEMCATCHTLITHALGSDGQVIGELPEQVPFLEWQHSDYQKSMSCQDCHMPSYSRVPIASVLASASPTFARHQFLGGNFLIPRMLNRYSVDPDLVTISRELDQTALTNLKHVGQSAAHLQLLEAEFTGESIELALAVHNLTGHKFPTAYPSRRAWVHLVAKDQTGKAVFDSGALLPNGRISGNDNDNDPARFESHYTVIEHSEQVQIYESILGDSSGRVTTGLLQAVRYLKDNRLLPQGFDKQSAPASVAVQGEAREDPDFLEGGDRIRYRIRVDKTQGPFLVEASLQFQPIGYRWARNLEHFQAQETQRFTAWFDSMTAVASTQVDRVSKTISVIIVEGKTTQNLQ